MIGQDTPSCIGADSRDVSQNNSGYLVDNTECANEDGKSCGRTGEGDWACEINDEVYFEGSETAGVVAFEEEKTSAAAGLSEDGCQIVDETEVPSHKGQRE